jgi:hypothetical protein
MRSEIGKTQTGGPVKKIRNSRSARLTSESRGDSNVSSEKIHAIDSYYLQVLSESRRHVDEIKHLDHEKVKKINVGKDRDKKSRPSCTV